MPRMRLKGTLLQIAELGQPVLRGKARRVVDVKNSLIQKLIDDLIATVKDVNGVGIAAPQVYLSSRVFIVASHPSLRYPNAPKMKPTAMINPEILSHSKTKVKDWEGCLSIPGIRGLVPRYKRVEVEYTDRKGKRVKRKFADFIARIFQHELDHLDGIVFLDRMESMQEAVTEKEYLKLVAKK